MDMGESGKAPWVPVDTRPGFTGDRFDRGKIPARRIAFPVVKLMSRNCLSRSAEEGVLLSGIGSVAETDKPGRGTA